MSDKMSTLLDAEEEMAKAIKKINDALEDLGKFRIASETLDEASKKSQQVLQALSDVARHLGEGAKLLKEEGVTAFRNELAGSLQQATEANKAAFKKLAEGLDAFKNKLSKQLEDTSNSVQKAKRKASLAMVFVIAFGVVNLGALGFIIYKLVVI